MTTTTTPEQADTLPAEAIDLDALEPCPFCGAQMELIESRGEHWYEHPGECEDCICAGMQVFDDAIAVWNRRAAVPSEQEPVAVSLARQAKADLAAAIRALAPMAGREGTRIYIDCEFNGWMGELLSFAMVADDGREFYSVLPEPRTWDEWCFANVFPVLNKQPVASYDDFRVAFLEFLRGFRSPVIVADWPADLYYFTKVLLGNGHGDSVLIPCRMELVACDYRSAIPHNALEDARAIMRAYLVAASPSPPALDEAGRDAVIEEIAKWLEEQAEADFAVAKDMQEHSPEGYRLMLSSKWRKTDAAATIRALKETR